MARRTSVAIACSAVLGAVFGLSATSTPAAAACDRPQDVYVTGAEAHWTECHNGNRTRVDGWVKDTKADGKCARVRASFSNGETLYSGKACPRNNVKEFHLDQPASDAQTYLYTEG